MNILRLNINTAVVFNKFLGPSLSICIYCYTQAHTHVIYKHSEKYTKRDAIKDNLPMHHFHRITTWEGVNTSTQCFMICSSSNHAREKQYNQKAEIKITPYMPLFIAKLTQTVSYVQWLVLYAGYHFISINH